MSQPAPTRDPRDESGFTMIAVVVVLLIGLAITTAAVTAALAAGNFSVRDARVRRAQQAADAGIQAQLYDASEADLGSSSYNLNGGLLGLSTSLLDCVVPQINGTLQITGVVDLAANTAGVCPEAESSVTGKAAALSQSVGENTTYQSEMITGQANLLHGITISGQNGSAEDELFPKIVSIGTESSPIPSGSGTVSSREEAILAPIVPLQAVEGENSVTLNGLSVCLPILGCANVASTLNGDVLSRGNLVTPAALLGLNLSNGLIATLAYGGSLSGGLTIANAQHVSPSAIVERQPLMISSLKPDCSVAANCTALGSAYNAIYDTFSLSSGSATFQGGDYVFCSFYAASGTTINVNPSSSLPVRIFIDSPTSTRCAADKTHGDTNLGDFNDPAGFTNQLLGTGGIVAASGMQVYVVGDGSYDDNTTVQVGPASTSGLLSLTVLTYGAVIYAPTSKVTVSVPALCVTSLLCTGGVFEGAVVGNDTTVNALTVTQDLDLGNFPLYAGVNAFHVDQYIQCDDSVTTLTQSTSDANGC